MHPRKLMYSFLVSFLFIMFFILSLSLSLFLVLSFLFCGLVLILRDHVMNEDLNELENEKNTKT